MNGNQCFGGAAEIAAVDTDPQVRVLAAQAAIDGLPRMMYARLATDPDIGVRSAVARGAKTPTCVIDSMAQDPDPSIRRFVAYRTQDARALTALAADSDAGVRQAIWDRLSQI